MSVFTVTTADGGRSPETDFVERILNERLEAMVAEAVRNMLRIWENSDGASHSDRLPLPPGGHSVDADGVIEARPVSVEGTRQR